MRTTKGIRGAITVDENSLKSIKNATLELFQELIKQNNLEEKFVSHVIFTATKDLTAVYPAKFIRQDIGWNNTAFMCMQEMNVENSLEKCIRVLIVYNCDENFEPEYIYLKDAVNLRTI